MKIQKYKQLIIGIIIGAILFGGFAAVADYAYNIMPNPFPIKVNGVEKNIEGYNINGYSYFKLRDIGEQVGFSVDFKEDTILIKSKSANGENKVDNTGIYVALGDSATTGYGLDNFGPTPADNEANKNCPDLYVNKFTAATGRKPLNLAVNGMDTTGLLSLLASLDEPQNASNKEALKSADVITLTIGGNNILVPLVQALQEKAQSKNASPQQLAASFSNLSQEELTHLTSVLWNGVEKFCGTDGSDGEFANIISKLRSMNPRAKLIVFTVHNPYNLLPLPGELVNMINAINQTIRANIHNNYTVADIALAFENDTSGVPLTHALSSTNPYDPHPNKAGNHLMYLALLKAEGLPFPYKISSSVPNITAVGTVNDDLSMKVSLTATNGAALPDRVQYSVAGGVTQKTADVKNGAFTIPAGELVGDITVLPCTDDNS